jgi:hypothetical protein
MRTRIFVTEFRIRSKRFSVLRRNWRKKGNRYLLLKVMQKVTGYTLLIISLLVFLTGLNFHLPLLGPTLSPIPICATRHIPTYHPYSPCGIRSQDGFHANETFQFVNRFVVNRNGYCSNNSDILFGYIILTSVQINID